MNKKTKIELVIISGIVLILVCLFFMGSKTFLKGSADVVTGVANNLTMTVIVKYTDVAGKSNTQESRSSSKIVPLLKIQTVLRGKDITKNKPELSVSFIDKTSNASDGVLSKTVSSANEAEFDWTSNVKVDPTAKTYDIRVSSPGYLSRKIMDIDLLNNNPNVIKVNQLVAGDVDQDSDIDWKDYATWKAFYGQNVINNPSDFNGDGIVDYKDYAASFGTPCYNATEVSQDTQCR